MVALVLLVSLQYVITWLSVRVPWFERLVKSEPTLVFHQGEFLDKALRGQRVTRDEVLSALRASGVSNLSSAAAVVLETDGSMSVLKTAPEKSATSTLQSVTVRPQ